MTTPRPGRPVPAHGGRLAGAPLRAGDKVPTRVDDAVPATSDGRHRWSGGEVVSALAAAGIGDVDDSALRRATHAADASLYRVVPTAVVSPHDADDVVATIRTCRDLGVPVTGRGAGTSIAGNAVGTGVVVDFSRHMASVIDVDVAARRAIVQPGVVLDDLQRLVVGDGLRLGPDPSTHDRATIGGMIGNNACGTRALRHGRTVDHVTALDVVLADGVRAHLGAGASAITAHDPGDESARARVASIDAAVRDLVRRHHDVLVGEFGRFPRQVSGYGMHHLVADGGPDLARALAGSEGTLGLVVEATVDLVDVPAHTCLVLVSCPDMPAAGDLVPEVLALDPVAIEGLDARITDALRERGGPHAVPDLPPGQAWLLVEVDGEDGPAARAAGRRVAAAVGAHPGVVTEVVVDPDRTRRLWRIREAGAGLSAVAPSGRPAHAGWEDSAVPVDRLGDYLRDFADLLVGAGLTGMPYGHFGDGCVHIRIDFPLRDLGGPAVYREFVEQAADLAVSYGGSLSGEHGDGRARSALLDRMYSPEALAAMARFKGVFDPEGVLNPGVLVDPRPVTADLRADGAAVVAATDGFAFTADDGDLTAAAHRCTGVGACVADRSGAGSVMCPSWRATHAEEDSTRGRAHVLQELLRGEDVVAGWDSPEVARALDLCLSCKACAVDCPTGVDMARLKSEVVHRRYAHARRPRSHVVLGALPRWADATRMAPTIANRLLDLPGLGAAGRWLAGIDQRRALPDFAPTTFRDSLARRRRAGHDDVRPAVREIARARPVAGPAVLWVDSFTDHFAPEAAVATLEVLVASGHAVDVVTEEACCGLTWISTGQLTAARAHLRRTVAVLAAHGGPEVPIVGVEPPCVAVLRDDLEDLLPDDDRAGAVAARARTLSEVLAGRRPAWSPPDLSGRTIVAQPHCHQHAVMGWAADRALLVATGAEVVQVGGCCGLAGNWGMEEGHHDVSVRVAELELLPALRAAPDDAIVLADGFSCRTQVEQLGGRRAIHLAELLRPH